jgi:hypothetical protein
MARQVSVDNVQSCGQGVLYMRHHNPYDELPDVRDSLPYHERIRVVPQ